MKILACLFTMKKLRSKNKNVDGDAGMCVCEGWGGGWGVGGRRGCCRGLPPKEIGGNV